jgi:transposase-like protein
LTLVLNEIFVDFEQGSIKEFKFHFPGAKITVCHFYFTSAFYKKISKKFLKLKPNENEDESDIDLCWDELKSERVDFGETDNKKLDQFTEYCETTWLNCNAMFPREIWNLHDNIFHRTNNISETYNKKINKEIAKPDYLMLISEYVQDFD